MKIIKKIKKNPIIIIALLGFFLKIYQVKRIFSLGTEQSASLWPIVKLWQDRKLTLIGQHALTLKSALFRPPFYIYLFALPLKLFNFNPLVMEIIFVLMGTANILIVYQAAKTIFDKNTGTLAAIIYAVSFNIINFDKNIWVVTPIIIISSLVLLLFSHILKKKSRVQLFVLLIGSLVSLGFSFHYQAGIMFLALLCLFLKQQGWKNSIIFLLGGFSFLLPLIFFNIRHDWIMLQGLKNLLSNTNNYSIGFLGQITNSLKAFSDLILQMLNFSFLEKGIGHYFVFLLLYLAPLIVVLKNKKTKIQKFFLQYFILCSCLSFVGLLAINPSVYQTSSFYLWYLIPLLLIIWSRTLLILFKNKLTYLFVLLFLFLAFNFYSFSHQAPGNYLTLMKISEAILAQPKSKWQIKFINREVLAYQYVFYYQAVKNNLDFDQIQLIEQWQEGQPSFFIIHGNYDWQEDKYQVQPYQKKTNFNGIEVIMK